VCLGLLLYFSLSVLLWIARRTFLFLVEIVPSSNLGKEDAEDVIKYGEGLVISAKLLKDIGSFTSLDRIRLYQLMPWQARLLFSEKIMKRKDFLIRRYQEHFKKEKTQIENLSASKIADLNELPQELKETFFEKMICNSVYFYFAIRTVISIIYFS
jgi:hypothetical protein